MIRMLERASAISFGLGATLAWVSPAAAQSPATDLGEIVVTAQKRSESLSKVPISVQAITPEAIEKQGLRDMDDVARITPGLKISTTGPFADTNVSIRGIFSTVGAATTGVYINDVAVQQRSGALPIYANLFDVERVEVLRGPQGTLYGAGSEGGTIRFITRAPSLTDYTAYGRGEVATTRLGEPTFELGAAVGGPIVKDRLGFRASVWGRRDGGWIDRIRNVDISDGATLAEDTNRKDSVAGRLALAWAPTDALTITPEALLQRTFKRDTDLYWERVGRGKQELKQPAPTETRTNLFSNTVEYRFAPFTARWIASYTESTTQNHLEESYFDVSALSGELIVPGFEDFRALFLREDRVRMMTHELRLSSNDEADDRLSWVAGLFWQRNKSNVLSREFEPEFDRLLTALYGAGVEDVFGAPMIPGGISYLAKTWSQERQLAAFADATYRVNDRLSVTGGLRVARTRYAFAIHQDGPWNGGPFDGDGSTRETPVTPKANVTYQLDKGLIYATAAKGYRIGGANASLGGNLACRQEVQTTLGMNDVPLEYKSDSVVSYEAGYKNRMGPLSLAASAFWVDWKDIQGDVQLDCFWSYTTNLGKAVSRGGDISVRLQASDGLTLGADLGYTDAHYSETFTLDNGTVLAIKGDKLPTPTFTAALSAEYQWSGPGGWDAYARGDLNYSSGYNRTPAAGVLGSDPSVRRIPASTLVGGRFGASRGGLDVSVFVENLFDEKSRLFRYHYTGNSDVFLAQSPRPRTVGVTLTYALD